MALSAAFLLTAVIVRQPYYSSWLLLASIFFCGATTLSLAKDRQQLVFPDTPTEYEAVLVSQPRQQGKVIRFDMVVTSHKQPFITRAALLRDTIENRYLHLSLGDGIRVFSTFERPKNLVQGSNFDYARWMSSQDIVAQTFIYWSDWFKTSVDYTHISRLQKVRIKVMKFRQRLISLLSNGIEDEEAVTLISALSLGDRHNISKSTRERFSMAGASHILALSGLHLGIIYFLLSLFFVSQRHRFLRAAFILSFIWLFALLVGMSASITRAALTLSLYEAIRLFRRDTVPLNTLAFAALVLLVANPLSLWDIGFQMSFGALLGILLFFPSIYGWLPKNCRRFWVLNWLWGTIAVSLAAQIMVAPLVAYYFGRFSCYFMLTNIMVVPLTYCILTVVLLFFLFTPLPLLQHYCGLCLSHLAKWLDRSVAFVSELPGASIEEIRMNGWQLLIVYLMLAALVMLYIVIRRNYESYKLLRYIRRRKD